MATRNSARLAWGTRTTLEEMRRETSQSMRELLAKSRPLPGVALPRPSDPQPGNFFALMEQKQAAMARQELVRAVGYDPRFLLPAGESVKAVPVPVTKPVTTRPAVLYLPAPRIAGLLPATVGTGAAAMASPRPVTVITFMDRPVDFIRWEDKKKQLIVRLRNGGSPIVWNAGYLIKTQGTGILQLAGFVPEWAKAVTSDSIDAIMRVIEEAVPMMAFASLTERVTPDLTLVVRGEGDTVLLVNKKAGRAIIAGQWQKCVLKRDELRAFLLDPKVGSAWDTGKWQPREVVAAHVNGEIRSRLDYWNKRGKGPAGRVLTLDCGLAIKQDGLLLWLLDPNDPYGRRAKVGDIGLNPATGAYERWQYTSASGKAIHDLASRGAVKLIEAVTEEVPF